jgi:parvulin-like peptidyl-prolyl isomerase
MTLQRPSCAVVSPRSWRIARLLRDPLVHFLAIGLVFYAAAHVVRSLREAAARTIVVDDAVRARLIGLYRLQTGSAPSPEQLAALVAQNVRDEVLYREGLKLGMDDDEIVRRRVIQKMQYLAVDSVPIETPTAVQLARFYAANSARFASPPTVSFHHLFFSPDAGGAAAARNRAVDALQKLNGGAEERGLGEAFALQSGYAGLSREDAAQIFGNTPLVSSLFAAPERRWAGPFRSGYGWHLAYVERRDPGRLPPFAADSQDIRVAYLEDAAVRARKRSVDALAARYHVIDR